MKNDKEPKFWLQLLKLIVGAVVIIVLVGLGLWCVSADQMAKPPQMENKSWGIVTDSPVRR